MTADQAEGIEVGSWWIDVADHQLEAELAHVRSEICGADVDLSPLRMTAFERYSNRV